jgi:hypothetical protein
VRPAISLTGPFTVRCAWLLGMVLSGVRELPGSTPIFITYREARKLWVFRPAFQILVHAETDFSFPVE